MLQSLLETELEKSLDSFNFCQSFSRRILVIKSNKELPWQYMVTNVLLDSRSLLNRSPIFISSEISFPAVVASSRYISQVSKKVRTSSYSDGPTPMEIESIQRRGTLSDVEKQRSRAHRLSLCLWWSRTYSRDLSTS